MNHLIIIGCILVAVGVFIGFTHPVEQIYNVEGGELIGLIPNFALIYLGIGIAIIGVLLGAYWLYVNLRG